MRIHIVQKADTLWKIAKKYGVDFEILKAANTHIKNFDKLFPGDKVKIPTEGKEVKKKKEYPLYTKKKEEQKKPLFPVKEAKKEKPVQKVEKKPEVKVEPAPIAEIPKPPKKQEKPLQMPQYPSLEMPELDCVPMPEMKPSAPYSYEMPMPQIQMQMGYCPPPSMMDCGCGDNGWYSQHSYYNYPSMANNGTFSPYGYGYNPMNCGCGYQPTIDYQQSYYPTHGNNMGIMNPYINVPGPTMPVSSGYPQHDYSGAYNPQQYNNVNYGYSGQSVEDEDSEQIKPYNNYGNQYSGQHHDPFWDIDVNVSSREGEDKTGKSNNGNDGKS